MTSQQPQRGKPAGAPDEERRPAGMPEENTQPEGKTSVEEQQVERDFDELLEETKRERDEYLDLARRTKADFENYRRRTAAETAAAARRGKAELASELVGVIDNLERALAAAGIDAAAALSEGGTPEGPLEQGIVLTYRELNAVLAKTGVEPYDPVGELFDPAWHEALQTRPDQDAGPGTVLEVLQKGYRLDGLLIRAARVVVSE